MLKPEFKKESTMPEFRKEKEVSELADGLYEGTLRRIFKNDLKQKPGYFLNIKLIINNEDYTYGQFVSERNVSFMHQNILLPLGLYCSEQGVLDCLNLRNLYVRFEKKSDGRFTNLIFKPLFEYKDEAPVGSVNTCLESNKNNFYGTTTAEVDNFDEDIPY